MKLLVVIIALVSVACASPYDADYIDMPLHMKTSMLYRPGMMDMADDTMLQEGHDFTEQNQQSKMELILANMEKNIEDVNFKGDMGIQEDMTLKMAEEMTGQAEMAENAQLQESMKQIQQDTGMIMNKIPANPQMIQQVAMKELQKGMLDQQKDFMLSTSEIEETLEAAFQAEMTMQNVHSQHMMKNPTSMKIAKQMSMDFQIQIQKLIEDNNMQKTLATITQQEFQMKQLKSQIQFLKNELRKLKTLNIMMMKEPMGFMLQTEQKLFKQLQKLMAEEMALQMVILQLQQVLMSQQKQMMFTDAKEMSITTNPTMTMMGMPMHMMMGMPMNMMQV